MHIIDISSPDQFTTMLKQKQIMCLYHWKYCGHCHSYMPIWEKVAKRCNVPVMRVELSVMQKLPKEHHVPGFPVVVLYENGKNKHQMIGKRVESDLHRFVTLNTKAPKPVLPKPVVKAKKTVEKKPIKKGLKIKRKETKK